MAPSSSSLSGKHVVVTGGSGGLGKSVVAVLEARGATVHVTPDPPGFRLDDEAQARTFFEGLPLLWASIHLVGGFAMKPLLDTSLDDLEVQWRINTVTCFLSCREAVRAIKQTGHGGRIVNVATRAVLAPTPSMTAYIASKAAVTGITQAVAAEVTSDRILVNAVLPSIIDTPANRAAMPKADHAAWPKAEEIAETIAFLASPENALTSGALVPVYGRS